jgi:hypothetical protein
VWPSSLQHYSGLSDADPSFRSLILRLRQLHWSIETAPYAALIKKYSKQSKHRAAFTTAVRLDRVRYSPVTPTVKEEDEEEDEEGRSGFNLLAADRTAATPVNADDTGLSNRLPVHCRDQGTSTDPDADTLADIYLADPPWEVGRRGSIRHPSEVPAEFRDHGEGRGFPLWASVSVSVGPSDPSRRGHHGSQGEELTRLSAAYHPSSSDSSSSSSSNSSSSSSRKCGSVAGASDLNDGVLIPTPDSAYLMGTEDESAYATSEDNADDILKFDADRLDSQSDLDARGEEVEAEADTEMARNAREGDGATDTAPVRGCPVPGTVHKYWHSPMLSWQKGLTVDEESAGCDEREPAREGQAALPTLPAPLRHSKRGVPFPVVSELKVDTAAAAKVCPTAAKSKSRAASLTAAFEVEVLGPLKGADQPKVAGMGTRTRSSRK